MSVRLFCVFFFFQAEDGIRDLVRSRGLGDVYKRQPVIIRQIGDLIGKGQEASALSDSIATAIAEVRIKSANIFHPRVYVEIYRNPLMSVSDESFVGDVIESAGGDNIFSKLERDYARVDLSLIHI